MPTMNSIVTKLIYLLSVLGMVTPPFMETLIPDPQKRAAVQVLFAFVGYVNHTIAAKSNPDGTPVNSTSSKTTVTVQTVEDKPEVKEPTK